MKMFDMFIYGILIVGALNWGLVGLINVNLIDTIFGEMSFISRLIYIVVGLAAIYDLVMLKAIWKRWNVHFKGHVHA